MKLGKVIAVAMTFTCLLPAAVYADAKDDRIAELEAQVAEMQKTIERNGKITGTTHRYLIVARKDR